MSEYSQFQFIILNVEYGTTNNLHETYMYENGNEANFVTPHLLRGNWRKAENCFVGLSRNGCGMTVGWGRLELRF